MSDIYSLPLPGGGRVTCCGGLAPGLMVFAFGYGLGVSLWLGPKEWLAQGGEQTRGGCFRWLLLWQLLLVVFQDGGEA